MTEVDAQELVRQHVGEDRFAVIARFAELVVAENGRQNLISPASVDHIWVRHILDSVQLLKLAPDGFRSWCDIGTGAGFPGLVIAALTDAAVTLVEPRHRRADFLRQAADVLSLTNVSVEAIKVERLQDGPFDVLSARAVAPLPALFAMTGHLRHPTSRMILPRGRNGATELRELPRSWRGMFHVEHSVTDHDSIIIVADGVRG